MHEKVSTSLSEKDKDIIEAIASNDIQRVKSLLEECVNESINIDFKVKVQGRSYTPLILSIALEHTDIAEYLIHQGADVNLSDEDDYTPLNYAAAGGYFNVVKLLVEKGANIDVVLNDQISALSCAAARGHIDIIRFLIESGVRFDVNQGHGLNAVSWAAESGHTEVVNLLTREGRTIPNLLIDLIFYNKTERAITLIQQGYEVEKSIFISAYKVFNIQEWISLYKLMSPFELAACKGNVEVIKLLMEKVEINKEYLGSHSLLSAIFLGKPNVVKVLLEKGVKLNIKESEVPLHLYRNAINDTSMQIYQGHTPLTDAVRQNRLDFVLSLLNLGADISIINLNGKNAIDYARELEDKTILKLLEKVNTYNEKPVKLKYMAAYTCWNIVREVEIDTSTETVCQAMLRHLGMKDKNIEIPTEMLSLIFDFTLQPNSKVIANEGGQQGEGTSIIKLTPPTRSQIHKWAKKIEEERALAYLKGEAKSVA